MRRKRFQRGSLKAHKRRGKMRWYAQWREEGIPRSKELGLCSEVSRISAEAMLQDILKLINEGAERREKTDHTFETFIELVYLPVYEQKWKDSTKDTETNRIRCHLVRKLRDRPMRKIDREEMQRVLNGTAKTCGQSMVDHLRFRLRSIFELAVSEGVADRNPAVALFTPKTCRPGRERALISCPPPFKPTSYHTSPSPKLPKFPSDYAGWSGSSTERRTEVRRCTLKACTTESLTILAQSPATRALTCGGSVSAFSDTNPWMLQRWTRPRDAC